MAAKKAANKVKTAHIELSPAVKKKVQRLIAELVEVALFFGISIDPFEPDDLRGKKRRRPRSSK